MKRLICSAAVASALLAATAVPSVAATISIMGMSAGNPATYDDIYTFHLTTPTSAKETVTVAGGEFNIANFNITGPSGFSLMTSPSPTTSNAAGVSGFFSGSALLGSGNYSFTVTGTGIPGTPFGFSAYNGNISANGKMGTLTPTPIPGTLVLFLSGLGVLGFWGWTKGRKGGLGSASMEAAAC